VLFTMADEDMTALRVTRSWVREWTYEDVTVPAHWIYRCVGDVEPGRAYAVQHMVTPEMAEDVPATAIEEMLREQWHRHLAEALRSGGPG
jgi:hypothetical protein